MKVLYIASSTPELESLELEREITNIQRRLDTGSLETGRFVFLPRVTFEEFAMEVTKHRPDILHISVHGTKAGLWFGTEDENRLVELQSEALLALLPRDHLPKLVLLNACNSDQVAKALAALPLVAIGSTAPITNQAAITSASVLYDRLISGATIKEAFAAMQGVVKTLQHGGAQVSIYANRDELLDYVPHRPPRLVARLPSEAKIFGKTSVNIEIGVLGCPESTTQIVFFTDDPSFLRNKRKADEDLEGDLTEVIRDCPRQGEIWTETSWQANGDFRVAACGIQGGGSTFSVSARVSDALELYVKLTKAPKSYMARLPKVLTFLRTRSGAGLADWKPGTSM